MSKTYSSDNIKVLSDREHIQLRKTMYIGEATDPRTLLSEIIDNALDECQAGYSEAIIVSIDTKNHKYEVRDYGRGIPHGKKELNGEMKETLEILLTKSNSGGKFDNSAYTTSSGLHGLGITITNALSKHICITSYRKGKYVQGEANGTDEVKIKYGKSEEPDGTHVVFEPDSKFFPTVEIPISFVKDRCRIASALGFRTRLIVDGEEIDTNATMFDLMKEENPDVSTYVQIEPITVESTAKEIMKVAIKYTSETNDRYFGYTNLLVNYLGGTHVQELSKTIIATWKEFIDKHKNVKPAIELHNNDYLVGMRAVCAVFISHPEFSSQTKEKLVVNKKYFEELMELFSKQLYKYLHEHADIAHQLVKRFEQYRAAQNALLSQKEIGSLIKINEESGDNIRRRSVVSKLVDCTSKKRDNTELFLCLAGDTPVKLLNGKSVPIKSLVDKENIWLYSTNPFGKFIQARMIRAFQTQVVRKLLRVYFSDGSHIDCTPEHRFMEHHTLIWLEAQNLRKWHQIHGHHGPLYVVDVKELYFDEDIPVYCLEIDSDEHSFVLGNGVVSHNCEGDSACLRWNTMIRLANDTEATIKEVCERVNNGEIIYVYGKPPKGRPNTGPNIYRVLAGGITRKNALLWRVYFDNDTYVDCTDDHKFMLKDRSFKAMKDLSPNDWISIMTYHKSEFKPYHTHIYHDIYCKYYGIDEIPEGYHVHHKDFNHYNNYPDNLELLTSSEHTTLHNQYKEEWQSHIGDSTPLLEYWAMPEHRHEHSELMKKRFDDPNERLKISIGTKQGMSKLTKEEHGKRLDLQKYNLSLAYYKDLIYYRKIFTIETIFDKIKFKEQKFQDGHRKSSWQYLDPETFMNKYEIETIEQFNQLIKEANHRVVKIECLNVYEDVYDIAVEDVHNFCLANDIMVHNCGPYLFTRNKELQAILPLRGKILNVTFKSIKEAVQNSEICDIANAIGAGIGASCDASKSRYDKIIISSDADEDGKHITSLLASLFVNLFPDLVKEGKVWIALPPLYSWGDNPKNFGWCNDINDIPKNVKTFNRFKGLGEMQPEQLKYYCVDPATRRQIMLEYPSDIDEFNRIVGSSQGKNDLLKELGIITEGI